MVGKKVIKYLDEYKLQEQELDVYCNILFGGGELTERRILIQIRSNKKIVGAAAEFRLASGA